jgi:hypothetical protein
LLWVSLSMPEGERIESKVFKTHFKSQVLLWKLKHEKCFSKFGVTLVNQFESVDKISIWDN